jgi:hypothetical protein
MSAAAVLVGLQDAFKPGFEWTFSASSCGCSRLAEAEIVSQLVWAMTKPNGHIGDGHHTTVARDTEGIVARTGGTYICLSHELKTPWSLDSLVQDHMTLSSRTFPPPKPSLKHIPARGPLKPTIPRIVVCIVLA